MSTITVLHYDAFSTIPHKGNPAGIVLDADELTEQDMTKAGILPIEFTLHEGQLYIKMKQNSSEFIPFQGNISRLAEVIGLQADDIDMTTPIVYGSTGIWTLLVPIKSLEKCKTMKPMNAMFPNILTELPRASVHPFCMETFHPEAFIHGRHFSSPYSGTEEDPVTGTASGVMGAYYLQYMRSDQDVADFYIEQGQEIDRDGSVKVHAVRNGDQIEVFIEGTAVFVQEIEVEHASSTFND